MREDISKVGAACVLPFVSRSPQRIVVSQGGNQFFSSNHTNDGLVFPDIVLHLSLNVGVVLENVLKVFLAVHQVLF